MKVVRKYFIPVGKEVCLWLEQTTISTEPGLIQRSTHIPEWTKEKITQ